MTTSIDPSQLMKRGARAESKEEEQIMYDSIMNSEKRSDLALGETEPHISYNIQYDGVTVTPNMDYTFTHSPGGGGFIITEAFNGSYVSSMADIAIPQSAIIVDVIASPAYPTPTKPWRDPTENEVESAWFNAIWEVIKEWDIHVPGAYHGYCGATGNHVAAILDAISPSPDFDITEQWK